MKVPRSLSKLLENKYVLYIVFFLAVTNVFGYLITQNIKAVGLFILIGYLVYIFNKNMIIVLGIPLIFTALYVSTGAYKEGLEGKPDNKYDERRVVINNRTQQSPTNEITPPLTTEDERETVGGSTNFDRVGEETQKPRRVADGAITREGTIKGTALVEEDARTTLSARKSELSDGMTNYRKKHPRLDYASTVEDAYGDLNQILGGDGIKRLTEDTQKLMNQQLQLADAMQSLTPLLTQAKSLVGSFDLKNLGGLADLAKQFGAKS